MKRWFNLHIDMMDEFYDEMLATGTEDATYENHQELIEAIKDSMQQMIVELNAIQTD